MWGRPKEGEAVTAERKIWQARQLELVLGGGRDRLPLVLGEAGSGPLPAGKEHQAQGSMGASGQARNGAGGSVQAAGLWEVAWEGTKLQGNSGWPLGHILFLRQIQEDGALAGPLQGKHSPRLWLQAPG